MQRTLRRPARYRFSANKHVKRVDNHHIQRLRLPLRPRFRRQDVQRRAGLGHLRDRETIQYLNRQFLRFWLDPVFARERAAHRSEARNEVVPQDGETAIRVESRGRVEPCRASLAVNEEVEQQDVERESSSAAPPWTSKLDHFANVEAAVEVVVKVVEGRGEPLRLLAFAIAGLLEQVRAGC